MREVVGEVDLSATRSEMWAEIYITGGPSGGDPHELTV